MGPPLPSLRALQVFEVAARLGSFTKAAGELHVTQTAVSHQVKQLEEELETPLFRRTGRGLTLTPAGQAWLAQLTRIFGQLHEANRKLRSGRERPTVSLTTLPSFAARWLVPRLGGFLARHPELDLRISSSETVVDFTLEPVDVGVRFGPGPYRGLLAEKLFEDVFVVVAAPERVKRLLKPRDLAGHPLLKDDHESAWPRWFAAHGISAPNVRYHQLLDSGLLVEAAARGQGVALARWSLVQDELAAGRLRRVFPKLSALPVGHAYHLVGLRETFRRPEIAAFRTWLRGEMRELGRGAPSAK
ncbi:MAG: transcriptional regulator [Polyangiaceae bacterium]|jgi:LysR family glycine cleavage system transcriptional activator|nr:transcriptional regulator [Polyangiaceae bacterium]